MACFIFAHDFLAAVTCLAVHHDSALVLTGAEDGGVRICNINITSSHKVLQQLQCECAGVGAGGAAGIFLPFLQLMVKLIMFVLHLQGMRTQLRLWASHHTSHWQPAQALMGSCASGTSTTQWSAPSASTQML